MQTPASYDAVALDRLSHTPAVYHRSMIHYTKPLPVTVRNLPSRNSSGGIFDVLPVELLHQVLSSLDFETLKNVRAVNYCFKALIEAFPPYKYLVKHALNALRALTDTRLIAQFDANQLYSTLRLDRCVCCNEFGPFLFLPTCERCCFNCLRDNSSLRLMTKSAAQECFGLSKRSLEDLPTMITIPGSYGIGGWKRASRRCLTAVRAAREFGIRFHGGQDRMEAHVGGKLAKKQSTYNKKVQAWLDRRRDDQRGPRPRPPRSSEYILRATNDLFHLMASTSFPSLIFPFQRSSVVCGVWDVKMRRHTP